MRTRATLGPIPSEAPELSIVSDATGESLYCFRSSRSRLLVPNSLFRSGCRRESMSPQQRRAPSIIFTYRDSDKMLIPMTHYVVGLVLNVWNYSTRFRDGASSSDDNSDTGQDHPDRDRGATPPRTTAESVLTVCALYVRSPCAVTQSRRPHFLNLY